MTDKEFVMKKVSVKLFQTNLFLFSSTPFGVFTQALSRLVWDDILRWSTVETDYWVRVGGCLRFCGFLLRGCICWNRNSCKLNVAKALTKYVAGFIEKSTKFLRCYRIYQLLTLFSRFFGLLPGATIVIAIADIQKPKFIRNIERFYIIVRYDSSHYPIRY